MKTVNITQYEAKNGVRFNDKNSCIKYEKFLELSDNLELIRDDVNQFLSDPDNYADWRRSNMNSKNFHYCSNVWVGEKSMSLEILYNKNSHYQLDENFCVDQTKWYRFLKKYEIEFYTKINVPNYYWCK